MSIYREEHEILSGRNLAIEKNWEILPYLKIPKKISDRFSLKNVHVSVLVFPVNSKNLNIGCTARFGEI